MNSIEDIAKMAIQEVGAELEDKAIKPNVPKPLRAAKAESLTSAEPSMSSGILENSAQNLEQNSAQNLQLNSSEQMPENSAQNISLDNDINSNNEHFSAHFTHPSVSEEITSMKNMAQNISNAVSNLAYSDDERQFLMGLKERLEVLFEGLKANDENVALRLDLTIRFLEFLLAKTNERLSDIQK